MLFGSRAKQARHEAQDLIEQARETGEGLIEQARETGGEALATVGERLGISPRTAKAHSDVLRQKLGVPRRRQIPVAYRALTGADPLSRSLKSAAADNGG